MVVYQYVSLTNSLEKILKVLDKNEKTKTYTILDLEDSLLRPFDPVATIQNRTSCREKLHKLSDVLAGLSYVGLRVNHCGSNDLIADVDCLNVLKKIKWNFFLLPKIENSTNIDAYIELLPRGSYHRLCFLIETKLGVDNLPEIMTYAKTLGVSDIHFGMWDYYLSLSVFPFPPQNSVSFWKDVSPVVRKITDAGLTYIHTPYAKLLDYQEYSGVISKVAQVSKGNFGVTSLTNGQTRCTQNLKEGSVIALIDVRESDVVERAIHLVGKFKGGSYTYLVDENNQFIAPHEFIAAKKRIN